MIHSPAFWIALFVALYLIFDGWRTFRTINRVARDGDNPRNMQVRVALVMLAGLALLALVIWMEWIGK